MPNTQVKQLDDHSAWIAALIDQLEAIPVAVPLADPLIEALYARAYTALEAGHHQYAMKLFVMLLGQRPTEARMLLGYAYALKGVGLTQYALLPIGLAAHVKQGDPHLVLAMAQCLIDMHEAEAARSILGMLVSACEQHAGDDGADDLAGLVTQAEALRSVLGQASAQHA